MKQDYRDVAEYIAKAPKEARAHLKQVRKLIFETVPDATEKMSYQMPYYYYHGRLIYFAGYKTYLGLYVMADAREKLERELEAYKTSKATYRFPLDKPLPLALIKRVVKAQASANKKRSAV
jgi:uncharacterized protein YdhG (YjbR/CyaY superfamily)